LPEPKGRSFGELDELFERGVEARRFRHMDLGVCDGGHGMTAAEEGKV
jgi:SP family general alpha glucoside:H+ symporter-like MFS transporter